MKNDPSTPSGEEPHPKKRGLSQKMLKKILELHRAGYGTRRIARALGCNRKTVQRHLEKSGLTSQPPLPGKPPSKKAGKLDLFRERIREMVEKDLSVTRILREISAQGYTGGRTILAEYVRNLRPSLKAGASKVRRRFETRPGEEMQVDWSPYRVQIGDKLRTVHAFCAVLHYSRKIHVHFYPNERLSTLLEAEARSFEDFGGVTQRVVHDRMATVVLGTIPDGKKPIWNPRFLDFARHFGFDPFLCRPRDPDRKGAVEKAFAYLERDFLRGASFASFEELNSRVRVWLDQVANRRTHGTTRQVPDEVWAFEKDFLTALPDHPFDTCDEELRKVDADATLWIRGTPYTVPWPLAGATVTVRLFSDHFEVLDPKGRPVLSRAYAPEKVKGKLQIDPAHYQGLPGGKDGRTGEGRRLEETFLTRFPSLTDFFTGLKKRMKGLAHIHLRALLRLAETYGEEVFLQAARKAQEHHAFNAHVIRRILEKDHPLPPQEPLLPPGAAAKAAMILGDVDSGSLDDYADLDLPGEEEEPKDKKDKEKPDDDTEEA